MHLGADRSKRSLQIVVHRKLGTEIRCFAEERGRRCILISLISTLIENIRQTLSLQGRERFLDSLISLGRIQAWHSLLACCKLISLSCERVHRSSLLGSL